MSLLIKLIVGGVFAAAVIWGGALLLKKTEPLPPKILSWDEPPKMEIDPSKNYAAVMETSAGIMEVEFFANEAPITVNNFIFLARQGFYEGTKFHRIISGFMIQGGDPKGNGTGGPGYRFDDEPVQRDYERGVIAMANAGPNTNGSQFFIMHADYSLPKNYVIFGKVTEGLDVLDKIAATPVGPNAAGELSRPLRDVTIKTITISAPR